MTNRRLPYYQVCHKYELRFHRFAEWAEFYYYTCVTKKLYIASIHVGREMSTGSWSLSSKPRFWFGSISESSQDQRERRLYYYIILYHSVYTAHIGYILQKFQPFISFLFLNNFACSFTDIVCIRSEFKWMIYI